MRATGLALFFLVVVIYSLVRSKAKVRTALWVVAAIGATMLLCFLAGAIVPERSTLFGVVAVDLSFLTGALAALVHSRRSAKTAREQPDGV
jgi:hypothetical protein